MWKFMNRAANSLISRASQPYAASSMDRLQQVCIALQGDGFGSSVCYWNDNSDTVEDVTRSCLRLLDLLRYLDSHSYLSVKLPAMRFDSWAVNVVLRAAARIPRLVHFDSHSPEDADRMFAIIGSGLKHNRNLGCTIPGRWLRSVDDARVACQWRLRVRVVKGQWADPRDPNVDMRSGFLKVIDELCGRASRVALASHDLSLVREAIRRLRDAGTPSELELLYGLPCREALRLGRDLGVPVRFYVPQGKARLPYLVNEVRRNPRILGRLARDVVRGYIHKSGDRVPSIN